MTTVITWSKRLAITGFVLVLPISVVSAQGPVPTGPVTLHVGQHGDMCLDASAHRAGRLQLWKCQGQPNQSWTLATQSGAFFQIAGSAGTCVAGMAESSQLQLSSCADHGKTYRFAGGHLVEAGSGACLTATGFRNGSTLSLAPCDPGNPGQAWSVARAGGVSAPPGNGLPTEAVPQTGPQPVASAPCSIDCHTLCLHRGHTQLMCLEECRQRQSGCQAAATAAPTSQVASSATSPIATPAGLLACPDPAQVDPMALFAKLAEARPFNTNNITPADIDTFVRTYSDLACGHPEVPPLVSNALQALASVKDLTDAQTIPEPMMREEALRTSPKPRPTLAPFAVSLSRLHTASGEVFRDFCTRYGGRLSVPAKRACDQQLYILPTIVSEMDQIAHNAADTLRRP